MRSPHRDPNTRQLSDQEWVAMRLLEACIRHGGAQALTRETAERCNETARDLLDGARRIGKD